MGPPPDRLGSPALLGFAGASASAQAGLGIAARLADERLLGSMMAAGTVAIELTDGRGGAGATAARFRSSLRPRGRSVGSFLPHNTLGPIRRTRRPAIVKVVVTLCRLAEPSGRRVDGTAQGGARPARDRDRRRWSRSVRRVRRDRRRGASNLNNTGRGPTERAQLRGSSARSRPARSASMSSSPIWRVRADPRPNAARADPRRPGRRASSRHRGSSRDRSGALGGASVRVVELRRDQRCVWDGTLRRGPRCVPPFRAGRFECDPGQITLLFSAAIRRLHERVRRSSGFGSIRPAA
jgi:hypothetical protein